MNSIVSFKNIDIAQDGTIQCNVFRDGQESNFYIRLPYSFQPEYDLIAAAFVAIIGSEFEQIHIDLPIGPEQHRLMEKWTGSRIVSHRGSDRRRKRGAKSVLNFSGGFDSLAAKVLEPDIELVSLDFGGRFSRERSFFEKFRPYIFETNLVDIGLNRYTETFMGIGSILMRDELDISSYSFGSIMAESAARLVKTPVDQQSSGIDVAKYFDMEVANPVAGLSEIASMKIVAASYPDQLENILMSVALPQEEKFLRKYQMLLTVAHDIGLALRLPEDLPKRPKGMQWGLSTASDLSSLYTMTVLGVDRVLTRYPEGIPDHFISFAKNNEMNFMNKMNPHAYAGVRDGRAALWYQKCIELGIHPFARDDWTEMANVMTLFDS